jgi:serine/alanine adding enzyme
MMGVRLYREEDGERWDAYVMDSKTSSSYHLIAWKNVIERSFGKKAFYILSEGENGSINGILPIVHMKSLVFGNFMVSLPYFNYGGICADHQEIGDQLLKEAINIARKQNVDHIELRHTHPIDNGLPVKTTKVCMELKLPQKAEELWNGFSSKLRSQIRRPTKAGMYAKIGREEELDSFYLVFSMNMRDLGTPVYSKEFFKNILREFPKTTWVCTVYTQEEQPVASGFLIGFKERLEIPWASSLRDFNHLSPNMLLYWFSLQFACENRYQVFDFGRSTQGEGTWKFKEQWGAKPIQLYWQYWLKKGKTMPELNPKNPKYQASIRIWKRLPVTLTKIIGPSIVKNLP